jgi:hypothetical protein
MGNRLAIRKMMGSIPMKVPVLAKDDFEPFCVMKAVKMLGFLKKAVDAVFGTISQRIQEEQSRVSNIAERIASAQGAIDCLNDSSTVVTILTPLKFAGDELPAKYQPLAQYVPQSSAD